MSVPKYLKWGAFLAGVIAPTVSAFAMEQQVPLSTGETHGEKLVSVKFQPPDDDRSAPTSSVGSGVRDGGRNCTEENQTPLTALTPQTKAIATVAPNPTLFVYVPETTATSAELLIFDDNNNNIYSQEFDLPDAPGLVKLILPETISLEMGKSYTWEFILICNPSQINLNDHVSGSWERVNLDSEKKNQLQQASKSLEQANIYGRYGIWNETLDIVAEMRDDRPGEWKELLNSVGIETKAIVEAPLVETVTLQ